jgi:DHA1 family tetracycline resistance protein-like MFS transporter
VGSLVLLRSHPELSGLAVTHFLMQLAHVVLPSVTVLYMGYRYGWNEMQVGLMLAGVGVCSMIVQGGLIKPIVGWLGERRALAAGLLFGAAGFAIYGLAGRGSIFLIGIPVMAMWGLAGASGQALMTRRVSDTEQGQLQGALQGITAIAGLFGPSIFTFTFAHFIGPMPGAPFMLASAMLLAATAIGWAATRAR